MGACGCADFSAVHSMPGPPGFVYAIQVYLPCANCGTGLATIVHRFSEEEWKRWTAPWIKEIAFAGDIAEHWIQMLDPSMLKEYMVSFAREHEGQYAGDGFVQDAVDHCLNDAIHATRHRATRAKAGPQ